MTVVAQCAKTPGIHGYVAGSIPDTVLLQQENALRRTKKRKEKKIPSKWARSKELSTALQLVGLTYCTHVVTFYEDDMWPFSQISSYPLLITYSWSSLVG
jgi:hypothetical protein